MHFAPPPLDAEHCRRSGGAIGILGGLSLIFRLVEHISQVNYTGFEIFKI
jgi:hypothetical protein